MDTPTAPQGASPTPSSQASSHRKKWILLSIAFVAMIVCIVWLLSVLLAADDRSVDDTQGIDAAQTEEASLHSVSDEESEQTTEDEDSVSESNTSTRFVTSWYPYENSIGAFIPSYLLDPATGEEIRLIDQREYVILSRASTGQVTEWVAIGLIDEDNPFALDAGIRFVNVRTGEVFAPDALADWVYNYRDVGTSVDVLVSLSDPDVFYLESRTYEPVAGRVQVGEFVEREDVPASVSTAVVDMNTRSVRATGDVSRIGSSLYAEAWYDSVQQKIYRADRPQGSGEVTLPLLEVPFDTPQAEGRSVFGDAQGYTESLVVSGGSTVLAQPTEGPFVLEVVDLASPQRTVQRIDAGQSSFLMPGERVYNAHLVSDRNEVLIATQREGENGLMRYRLVLYPYNAASGEVAYEERVEIDLPAEQPPTHMVLDGTTVHVAGIREDSQVFPGPSYWLRFDATSGDLLSSKDLNTLDRVDYAHVVVGLFKMAQ